jgi:biotin carboxylase
MKCAIVDAYGSGRLLPGALRRHGVECVHVRSEFPDVWMAYRPDDFAVDIAHRGDVAQTAAELRRLGVGFVGAAAESGVLLADELSATLGTPGNGMRHPAARRDKFQMQQVVREAGLAGPDSFVFSSGDGIVSWARGLSQWPVILKPLSSAGADNVIVCASVAEVLGGFRTIMANADRYGRHNDAVLAQQYLSGEEYYVNTVSRRGVHRILEIWHYDKKTVAGRPLYDYEDLLSLDDLAARQCSEFALGVLDALEIRNGAGHTEIMLTKDGPFLVECAARLSGGQMPELVSRCIGTNQVDMLAYSIASPEEFSRGSQSHYRLRRHLRCVNLISLGHGTMPAGRSWDPIRSLGSFADLVLNLPEGSRISPTVDLATCPGFLSLSSADAAQVDGDYARLRQIEEAGLYS